jgi:hypothetical protein
MLPIEGSEIPIGFDAIWTQEQFNTYIASVNVNTAPTKEFIHKQASVYQDRYYDDKGLLFLLNLKVDLIRGYGAGVDAVLPFQMIEAVNKWVNNVWSKAFEYDAYASAGVAPTIDYESSVGLPPCSFRDILWVINPVFQALEPNRPVNMDINYYISYINA